MGKFASKTVWVAAVAGMALPSIACAAGLGKISVLSALGQPLKAEIEIVSLQRGEGDSLAAKLASGETFRQANVDLNPALLSVKFAIERRAGGQYVMTLASGQAINEPFIDMLVELNWSNGRLVREYTFLLDPPEYAAPSAPESVRAPQVSLLAPKESESAPAQTKPAEPEAPAPAKELSATPAPTAQSEPAGPGPTGQAASPAPEEPIVVVDAEPGSEKPEAPAEPAGASALVRAEPAAPAEAPASTVIEEPAVPRTYEVKRGDTLSKIVLRNRVEGASLQQMLVAMFRANQDAFVGENMNRLRAGKILKIPEQETSFAVPAVDARRIVSTQYADFNEYKRRLGIAVAAGPGPKEGGRQASGQISVPKEEKPAAPKDAPKDQLRLSSAEEAKRGAKAAAAATADDLAARDKALKEANERIALLEKNLQDLQKLAQIKSQSGAQLQQQAQGAKTEAAKAAPAAKTAEPAKASPGAKGGAPKPAEVAKGSTPPPAAAKSPEVAKPADLAKAPTQAKMPESVPAPAARGPEGAKAPEPAKAGAPKAPEAAKAAPESVAKAPEPSKTAAGKVAPKAAPIPALPEPSFVEELLDNPMALGGAGGAAILLVGYAAYAWRRKRTTQFESSVMSVSPTDADSVLGTAGGRSVDTGSSSFQSDFSKDGVGKMDSEEIDPIAEADVYMAYGRDAQAEEILKEALAKDSSRQSIRVKLLEIYANRKDTSAFETAAKELHAATGGQGPEWGKVAGLGLSIDPTNRLYGGKGGPAAQVFNETAQFPSFRAPAPEPTTQGEAPLNIDFDIGAATGGASPAPDINLDAGTSSIGSAPAGLDFDLGLGTARSAAASEPARAEPAAETAISIDFDLPIGDKPGQAASAQPASPASAPAIGGIDFDLAPSMEAGGHGSSAPALDLGSISLDLGAAGSGNGSAAAPDARWQEVATKLDLAKAYEEMGDKDGARELLKEVMKEGDTAQQQRAQTMLQAIG